LEGQLVFFFAAPPTLSPLKFFIFFTQFFFATHGHVLVWPPPFLFFSDIWVCGAPPPNKKKRGFSNKNLGFFVGRFNKPTTKPQKTTTMGPRVFAPSTTYPNLKKKKKPQPPKGGFWVFFGEPRLVFALHFFFDVDPPPPPQRFVFTFFPRFFFLIFFLVPHPPLLEEGRPTPQSLGFAHFVANFFSNKPRFFFFFFPLWGPQHPKKFCVRFFFFFFFFFGLFSGDLPPSPPTPCKNPFFFEVRP